MRTIVLLLLLTIIVSCNTTDDDTFNNSTYSKYITKNFVDSDINFYPEEKYGDSTTSQTPLLKLKLVTTKIFPCINFILNTTEFINGNELIIRLDEILKPGVCLTALGPASSYLNLPKNTNRITFINGSIVDRYSVAIDQEKVSLSLIENNFTNSLYNNTFRYPENSFAYVCGTNTNNTVIYEEFLAILDQNPSFTEFKFEGKGRIPYPESSDGNWVNHPSRFFIYSELEEFSNIKNVLNNYSKEKIEKDTGVSIAIYSWNNINCYSWDTELKIAILDSSKKS